MASTNQHYVTIVLGTVYSPSLTKIYVGVTGSLILQGAQDPASVTFSNVPVGWFDCPWPVGQVLAGSTATGLIGCAQGVPGGP